LSIKFEGELQRLNFLDFFLAYFFNFVDFEHGFDFRFFLDLTGRFLFFTATLRSHVFRVGHGVVRFFGFGGCGFFVTFGSFLGRVLLPGKFVLVSTPISTAGTVFGCAFGTSSTRDVAILFTFGGGASSFTAALATFVVGNFLGVGFATVADLGFGGAFGVAFVIRVVAESGKGICH
jgi:hypothetical protein